MHNPNDVLNFWLATELFTPVAIDKISPNDCVYRKSQDAPFPWEREHPHSAKTPYKNCQWSYTVYAGVFKTNLVQKEFPAADEQEEIQREQARMFGDSSLFAFEVDQRGRLVDETFVLSATAWGVSRLRKKKKLNLSESVNFDTAQKKIGNENLVEPLQEKQQEKLDHEFLESVIEAIAKELQISDWFGEIQIRVKARQIKANSESDSQNVDYLNSFYLDDLDLVVRAVAGGEIGSALKTLLQPASTKKSKFDVRENSEGVFHSLSPTRFPCARWPSKGHFPLVTSQQFAVNQISEELTQNSGIFAVNGPPGTGKTTLLRDLMAMVVVDRAKALAEFKSPSDAFNGFHFWGAGQRKLCLPKWSSELSGFEIVVASNNNGAVENVTMETPARDAVDQDWLEEADYFSEIASNLIGGEAWGMLAAKLGNKTNRRNFADKFYWKGMREQLTKFQDSETPPNWQAAVNSFRQAIRAEKKIRETVQPRYERAVQVYELVKTLKGLAAQEQSASDRSQVRETEAREIQTALNDLQQLQITDQGILSGVDQSITDFRSNVGELQEAIAEKNDAIDQLAPALSELKREIKEKELGVSEADAFISKLKTFLPEVAKKQEQAKQQIVEKQKRLDEVKEASAFSFNELQQCDLSLARFQAEKDTLVLAKPGGIWLLLARIRLSGKYRNWEKEHSDLTDKLNRLEASRVNLVDACLQEKQKIEKSEEDKQAAEKKLQLLCEKEQKALLALKKQKARSREFNDERTALQKEYEKEYRKNRQNIEPILSEIEASTADIESINTAISLKEVEANRISGIILKRKSKIQQESKRFSVARQLCMDAQDKVNELKRQIADVESKLAADWELGPAESAAHPRRWADSGEYDWQQRLSPWAEASWHEARARVFIAALKLHRAFILNNAKMLKWCFGTATDLMRDGVSEISEDKVRSLWQTITFAVPVVSTTFASFSRLFQKMGAESIGWLLIDEAGQAAPPSAVGAIWRSKRVVVVGDPLQLSPVVTIPKTLEKKIARECAVKDEWFPSSISVQELADQQSTFGTMIDNLWVGSPLCVHRRCDDPMFSISNHVAYDGLMVQGVVGRSELKLTESAWFDVASDTSGQGHWKKAEGDCLRSLLDSLIKNQMVKPEDIMMVSPFRSCAYQLKKIGGQEGYKVPVSGTVHTAQGKEADVVILVLGGATSGARSWAASTPNLLNVAVSRAKRRLYVIGNHRHWSKLRYFDECAARLPRREPLK